MKRYTRYIILAALLPAFLLTGCSKALENGSAEQGRKPAPAEGSGYGIDAYAVDGIDFGTTKTWLTPDCQVAWTDGDQVRFIGTGGTFTAVVMGDEVTHAFLTPQEYHPDTGEGDKAVRDQVTGYLEAYYPAEIVQMSDRRTTKLPDKQYWNAENILSVNPMYAKDTCEVLQFHNICGLLQLRLKGTKTVKSIEVWTDKTISGNFSILEEEDENGIIRYKAVTDNVTPSEGDRRGVTLDCTKPSATGTAYPEEGVVLSKEGSLFYVSLPDSTYNWLKIRITTKDGYTAFKKIPDTVKIQRNTVYYTEFTPVWGVQLAEGDPVWSLCNLGAENEWEYGDYYCWAGTEPLYRNIGREYVDSTNSYAVSFTLEYWKGGFTAGYIKENAAFYDAKASTPGWYKYTPTDHRTELDVWDDPVTQKMGPSWRTPTKEEIASVTGGSEAFRGPVSDPTKKVKGVEFPGMNPGDAKLFIPYAGYADSTYVKKTGEAVCLWSNEVNVVDADRNTANGIFEGASAAKNRGLGFSVRGVCPTASDDDYSPRP